MPSSGLDTNYHLLRVRVKKHIFYRLQELAMEETHSTGEYTTVSDLVRSAIYDWLQMHDATKRLEALHDPTRNVFRPSGLAVPSELIAPLLEEDEEDDDEDVDDEEPEDDE